MHATSSSTQSGGSPVTEDEESMSPFSSPSSASTNGASFAQLLQRAAQTGDAKQIAKLVQTARTSASSPSSSIDIAKRSSSSSSSDVWLDAADEDGFAALHLACVGGHDGAVHELLRAGAHLEIATPEGFTALMFAAWAGSLSLVQTLVSLGADTMARDVDGNDAAFIAEMNEHASVAKFLHQQMENPEDPPRKRHSSSSSKKSGQGQDLDYKSPESSPFKSIKSSDSSASTGTEGSGIDSSSSGSSTCSSPEQLAGKTLLTEEASPSGDTDGATPLHVAAMHGQLETVKVLLARGASLSAALPGGATGLHLASASGFVEVASYLIDQGLPVDERTVAGTTPLHEAAFQGHAEVAALLLERGANVDAATESGTTPLHRAAENGHVQIAELLIAYGAHIDAVTTDYLAAAGSSEAAGDSSRRRRRRRRKKSVAVETEGNTPVEEAPEAEPRTPDELEKEASSCRSSQVALCLAAKNGHLDMVQYLLTRGAVSATDLAALEPSRHPIMLAARRGHLEIVRFLLAHDECASSLQDAASRVLCCAAEHGYLQMVEHALARGADIEAIGGKKEATPLVLAARQGHLSVVLHLLWGGAKLDAATASTGYTALHYAAKHGHLTIVNSLLLNGADVDAVCAQRQSSPLHLAAESGHGDVVRCLLSFDANVDAEKHPGTMTSLHIAAERGHVGVARELLAHGARLESQAQNDLRALFIAAYCGHKDVVELLLDHGAELEVTSGTNKTTPLRGAVSKGRADVVELLLARGADVNATQPTDGTTSLHSAAANGFGDILKLLVTAGADPDRVDREGLTPMDYAASDPVRLQLRLALLKSHWQKQDGRERPQFPSDTSSRRRRQTSWQTSEAGRMVQKSGPIDETASQLGQAKCTLAPPPEVFWKPLDNELNTSRSRKIPCMDTQGCRGAVSLVSVEHRALSSALQTATSARAADQPFTGTWKGVDTHRYAGPAPLVHVRLLVAGCYIVRNPTEKVKAVSGGGLAPSSPRTRANSTPQALSARSPRLSPSVDAGKAR
ncbi:Ankyrin-3 [Phytophthora pseudosyringae]|uniref:Ankyrin-3 n=1 Tax=Phytophthora pseudosyringae TaxID=221518 RepID=A0A8T1V6F0_9STRA|nr:Ankyrin-3 [Phytophthora pseudosyringae]